MIGPLKNGNFRLLLLGELTYLLGNNVHLVILAWLALQITGSSLTLGSVLMAAALPKALFMFLGGTFSDRYSLKIIMVLANLMRAVIAAVLALLICLHAISVWHLYLSSLLIGVADSLFQPALMTSVPRLLKQQSVEQGNAFVRGAMQLSTLLGSAPAGLLLTWAGMAASFGMDALIFLSAVLAIWLIAEAAASNIPKTKERSGLKVNNSLAIIDEMKAGLSFAWKNPAIRDLFLTVSVIHLSFTGTFIVGLAAFAEVNLPGGAVAFGLIRSCFGGGALLGSIISGLFKAWRPSILFGSFTGILAVGLVLFSLTRDLFSSVILALIMGVINGIFNVTAFSWLQRSTSGHMLGRMMGLVNSSALLLAPVSFILAGAIAEYKPSLVFLIAGIPLSIITGYLLLTRKIQNT